jgi:class 3 adenylate cyclase
VAARARGGEVLVTSEIADACASEFEFTAAGTVELKGFDGEYELWQVEGRRA